jgi:hypothetical protein
VWIFSLPAGVESVFPASEHGIARALGNDSHIGLKRVKQSALLGEGHTAVPDDKSHRELPSGMVRNIDQTESTKNIKWAGNQEAVTFLGYRPIRS